MPPPRNGLPFLRTGIVLRALVMILRFATTALLSSVIVGFIYNRYHLPNLLHKICTVHTRSWIQPLDPKYLLRTAQQYLCLKKMTRVEASTSPTLIGALLARRCPSHYLNLHPLWLISSTHEKINICRCISHKHRLCRHNALAGEQEL